MLQRRRPQGVGEVVVAREDRPPVRHLEEGGEPVPSQTEPFTGRGDPRRKEADAHQRHQQRRRQAPYAPGPERAQPDVASTSPPIEEQRSDQVPGEDEEQVDAEIAAAEVAGVMQEDGRHRQAPQPVEGGHVREPHPAAIGIGLGPGHGLRSGRSRSAGF